MVIQAGILNGFGSKQEQIPIQFHIQNKGITNRL